MRLFTFQLTAGGRAVASEQLELGTVNEARARAIASARSLAERHPKRAWQKWSVIVTDHRDNLVFVLPLETFGGIAEPLPAASNSGGAFAQTPNTSPLSCEIPPA